MKTKITILLLTTASLLFNVNVANAQTCGTSQVTYSGYTSNFLPKWNATNGCISNSIIYDSGDRIGFGLTAPASLLHSSGQIRTGIPYGGLGGASATTGALLFYNSSNTNTVNIQSGGTTTSYSLTLPSAQGAGFLSNNGSGGLDWLNVQPWVTVGNSLSGTLPTSPIEWIGTINAADWIIKTNSTERMRVLSTGNVGIGTTSPGYLLEVAGNSSIGGKALVAGYTNEIWTQPQTNANAALYINYRGYADGVSQFRDLNISNGRAGNIAFFQGSTGNVGIGTIAPAAKLDLWDGSQYFDLTGLSHGITSIVPTTTFGRIINNNVGGGLNISGYSSGSNRALALVGTIGTGSATIAPIIVSGNKSNGITTQDLAATDMLFQVNNNLSTQMSMLGNGNVGIGTTSPGYTLEVNGTTANTAGGLWTVASDIRVKTDTSSFTDGLSIIKQIHPVNFRYNGKTGIRDTINFHIGVIAQQVQSIAPYTVGTYMAKLDTSDVQETQFLDFNGSPLIYLFVNAFKELDSINVQKDSVINILNQKLINSDSINTALNNGQQQSIDSLRTITTTQGTIIMSLQDQLTQLASLIDDCCNSHGNGQGNNSNQTGSNNLKSLSTTTLTEVELSDKNIVVLNQNVPNPFAEQTIISYYLPDNVQRAQILFFQQSGKIVKTVDLTEKGKGQLNVFANDLSNGIYTYSLIIDGQIIETKKMIKQ